MKKQQLIEEIKSDGCVISKTKLNELTDDSLEFIIELRDWTKRR